MLCRSPRSGCGTTFGAPNNETNSSSVTSRFCPFRRIFNQSIQGVHYSGHITLVNSEDQPRSKIISKRSKRSKRSSPVDDLWVNIVSPSASLFQNIWRKYSRVESKTKQYKVPQRRDIWINESIHQPRLNSLQRGQEPLLGCICNPCSTETKNSKIVKGK